MSQSNEEILCSLQRQVALLRRALSAVVAVMLITLLCAAVAPEEISDVIRAHKIVVVNKSGQRMVELSYTEEGSFAGDPQISEKIQTSEHMSDVGGVISTFTPCSEQPTAVFGSSVSGGSIQLSSNKGSIVVDASANNNLGGVLQVNSVAGSSQVSLMATKSGGSIRAHNLNGDTIGLLQSGSDQSGELGIFNRFQKQIVTLSDSNDYGRMAIHSNTGKPSLLFAVNQGGGSIAGLDFSGKVKFQFGLEKDMGSKLGKPLSSPKDSE